MEHDAKELEKEKIRTRYKGVSPELLEEIPGEEYVDILKDEREKRVGVYVRVSTDDPRQTSSFELQRNHYTDLIDRYPNWKLYRIYADEGISGTSLKHRKQFLRMIEDCKLHKLDLIVTKSVSRFARNIYHCIGYIRMLASLTPPVGVLFETEGLYTLRDNSEMALTFTASFAQEESRTKSSSMNLSYEMRFRRGIFMLPKLLGYDKDEEGNLVINAAVAMISVGALAVGYLLMNLFSSSSNLSGDMCSTLFGSTSILTLTKTEVRLCAVLSIIVAAAFVLFYHKVFAVTFDESFAAATGVNTGVYNFIIAVIIAVIIVLAMNLVGSLLISALVIFPALSAMRVFKSFRSVTICSAILSVFCALLGILISILAGTPVGSTIVAADIVMFFAFSGVGLISGGVHT